jgi:hypothetical protein
MDELLGHAHSQGLTERRLSPEELFDKGAGEFRFQAAMHWGANPGTQPRI